MKLKTIRKHLRITILGSIAAMTLCILPTSKQGEQIVSAASFTSDAPEFTIQTRKPKKAILKIESMSEAAYYKIYRSTTMDGNYVYTGTTSNTSFTDTNLSPKSTYYYKMVAFNKDIQSKYSKVKKIGASLGKVQAVTGIYNDSKLTVNWNQLASATKYKIYRSDSKEGTYVSIGSSKSTSYVDSSVLNGKTYYYKVRAYRTKSGIQYQSSFSSNIKVTCDSNKSDYVEEVLRLVNVERKKEGLSELSSTSLLNQAAYQRAVETKTSFSHTRPDGSSCFTVLADFKINYMRAGENIAYGQPTPEVVVTTWMNSSGHRANIMNSDFGKIGIGCYYSNGIYYWTQLFTN